jgi:NTP pyrophosphatase (non-canonical NTP hydrolase)
MKQLVQRLRQFAREREWEQFHSPKNLAMALSVEVAEIVEHFQWLTEEESRKLSPDQRRTLKDEIGDVLIYLANLADQLDIDPVEAAEEKLAKNEKKYPAQRVKGKSLKYSEY